ncbi:MAG: hypothetical protein Q7S51_09065, partial [Gallionellaceae bacterium]|nr:hypothetical protein [Gallionellaceae bacterium]
NSYRSALPLDGVTGHILLKGHQFHREGLPAQIRQGRAQLSVTDSVPPKPVNPSLPKVTAPSP